MPSEDLKFARAVALCVSIITLLIISAVLILALHETGSAELAFRGAIALLILVVASAATGYVLGINHPIVYYQIIIAMRKARLKIAAGLAIVLIVTIVAYLLARGLLAYICDSPGACDWMPSWTVGVLTLLIVTYILEAIIIFLKFLGRY